MWKEFKTYINPEKRTVVTTIKERDFFNDNLEKYTGKSKCSPEDNFDIELGKRLSLSRAWLKYDECKLKFIQKEKSLIEDKLQYLKNEESQIMDIIDRTLDRIENLVNSTEE